MMVDEGAAAQEGVPDNQQPGQAVAAVINPGASKMTKEQEEEFKELLLRFKAESSPLMHILSLYSYFFTKFHEAKDRLEKQI